MVTLGPWSPLGHATGPRNWATQLGHATGPRNWATQLGHATGPRNAGLTAGLTSPQRPAAHSRLPKLWHFQTAKPYESGCGPVIQYLQPAYHHLLLAVRQLGWIEEGPGNPVMRGQLPA